MRILHIYEIFIILAETLNYKLTRTKSILAALCGVFVLAGVAFATDTVATKSQKEISNLTKQNLEALVQSTREGGLDCNYSREESKCSIYIGANGRIKLFGVGIIKADANGWVNFDGKVVCRSGGNATCKPIECADLYQIIK